MHRLITRRRSLATLGAIAGTATLLPGFAGRPAFAADAEIPALRSLAAARGIVFGSDSDVAFNVAPPEYFALFVRQSALYAPPFVWKRISPEPNVFDFSHNRASIDMAFKAGLKLTGCHFLWHQTAPDWLLKLSRPEAERAITEWITRASAEYRGNVYSWNVTNEAINTREGRADGLRNESPYVKIFGQDYMIPAFHAARAADPKAILAYNEYDLELDTSEQEARRKALLRLVDYLLSKGAPIDAVGLQSHLKTATFGSFDEKRYRAFLKEIADRKLKILLTELDVLDVSAPGDFARRDQEVADIYAHFLRVALDETAVKAVVVWGLTDRYTWYTPRFSPKFARADGLPTRPLPFDDALRPKPAFWAIANALKSAPAR
ncbi:MAG: endo-1,4-beta-xylanase [Proteobacteria bacterium]|nr:endo-1,4-beta-xylanase [Pseudomonadota bacterium]